MEPDPKAHNLRELLEAQVRKFPNKTFLYFFNDGRKISYAALNRQVNQVANLFLRLGISKGQTLSLLLPNIPEYVLCYFACMKIGAVASPLNIHLKSKEIEYILANSESRLLVTNQKYWRVIEPVRAAVSSLQYILLLDGALSNTLSFPEELTKESTELAPISLQGEDVAIMIYTSGTTGEPKGCLLTHGNFLFNIQEIATWLNFSERERLLCIMPLFHVNGIVVTMLTPLYIGGSMVLMEKFSTHKFWEIIDRYRVTSFGSVATMLTMLNQTPYPEGYLERLDKSYLRFALSGSAPPSA